MLELQQLERSLFFGRNEVWLLPAGTSRDGCRAHVTTLMAGDNHDGRTDSLKRRAKPGNWELRRKIQTVFSDLIQERKSFFAQTLVSLQHFRKRRIGRFVGLEIAAPIEQRLPMFDRVWNAT